MQNRRIVECVGVPAAGKTTIAVALRKNFIKSRIPVTGNYSLHQTGSKWKYVVTGLQNLFLKHKPISIWKSSQPLSLTQRIRLLQVVAGMLAHSSEDRVLLYDQGVNNFLLTRIAYGDCTVSEGRAILRTLVQSNITLPTHIILVVTNHRTSYTRLLNRDKPHKLKTVTKDAYLTFCSRYDDATQKLVSDYAEIVYVDGEAALNKVVCSVFDTLAIPISAK